jgi:hypothetical protein
MLDPARGAFRVQDTADRANWLPVTGYRLTVCLWRFRADLQRAPPAVQQGQHLLIAYRPTAPPGHASTGDGLSRSVRQRPWLCFSVSLGGSRCGAYNRLNEAVRLARSRLWQPRYGHASSLCHWSRLARVDSFQTERTSGKAWIPHHH